MKTRFITESVPDQINKNTIRNCCRRYMARSSSVGSLYAGKLSAKVNTTIESSFDCCKSLIEPTFRSFVLLCSSVMFIIVQNNRQVNLECTYANLGSLKQRLPVHWNQTYLLMLWYLLSSLKMVEDKARRDSTT